ncbi:lysozyme inhibitor LprI family protein [Sutcliffiella horikoshii]|uniref:lysozyme inhibitor LprI family protein n=1 Tax=Sutcliffiella horikoshii TaxID=79883 RepID=UPI00299EBC01|nr:lysozyme inhibitor LprI family protein [Sutcliffiella horikoshii]
MQMKNRKLFLWFVALVIGVSFLAYNYLNSSFYKNGNDEESIVQTIQSIDMYADTSIDIIDIKDVEDERLVAFLSNNLPAYIHFIKDKYGNYIWISAEIKGEPLSHFFIHLTNRMDNHSNLWILTIATYDNEISKMELRANQHVYVEEFSLYKNSTTWLELPKEEKDFSYDYIYYDKNGKLIESEDLSTNEPAEVKKEEAPSSLKETYLQQLDDTKKEAEELEPTDSSTYALKKVENDRWELWDELLNEIYGVLREQLSEKEMSQLRKEQRDWIKFRDDRALEASLEFKGGTQEQLEYVAVLANLTEERCYELVEDYMK